MFENQQNPFSKPIFNWNNNVQGGGAEKVKQPAGALNASKLSGESAQHDTKADLRLLVLADANASFYSIVKHPSTDSKDPPFCIKVDATLPQYPQARIARFAPKSGSQAAVVSNVGLHFIDMLNKKESLLLIQLDLVALEYSPCDSYVVCCEKWNPQNPTENLFIICTKTGKTIKKFQWLKTPKDSIKSIRFSDDEKYCLRLVPQANAKDVNSVEIYKDGNFSAPSFVIAAKFATKATQNAKKGIPPVYLDGHFDGLDLCSLNPAVEPEKSPFYMFAWQHAQSMSTEEDCGNVYAYDLHNKTENKQKFMISCPKG